MAFFAALEGSAIEPGAQSRRKLFVLIADTSMLAQAQRVLSVSSDKVIDVIN